MMKSLGKRYADLKGKEKKGFTLLEIVVVIAIMAILALVLVPNLTAWVGKADEARLKADLKNVHTAAELVRQTSKEDEFDADSIANFANLEAGKVTLSGPAAEGTYLIEKVGANDERTKVTTVKNEKDYSFDGKDYVLPDTPAEDGTGD